MGNVNFSLEVTTRTNLSELPKLNDIYVTFLPGTSYKDVIEQTKLYQNQVLTQFLTFQLDQ